MLLQYFFESFIQDATEKEIHMHKVTIGIEDGEYYAVIDSDLTAYRDTLESLMGFLMGYTLGMPFELSLCTSLVNGVE